jgi:NADPH:quinone reductase-like Zn-dependent oxidoreductase
VAGETQERSFKVLRQGGALISTLQEPDKAKALYKNIKIARYMVKPDAAELAQIAELLAKGKIKPVVHATFDLGDTARAQIALAKDHVRGKVVITVNGQV